ncbi:hypothetical protein RJ641_017189 [Dillenia turbinata]|uniref:Uncharacterized protein n=1 Tax=Dillenia turbinata TaxID=194707 RepID=A0AAN8YZI4_9MAGN
MWSRLAAISRNVQNIRKSPRVADENMLGENFGREMERRRNHRNGSPIIYSILRAPFSLFSCFSHPHGNGIDGVWVSGELAHISEMNYLMVSDSMRYAILISSICIELEQNCVVIMFDHLHPQSHIKVTKDNNKKLGREHIETNESVCAVKKPYIKSCLDGPHKMPCTSKCAPLSSFLQTFLAYPTYGGTMHQIPTENA